MLFRSRKEFLLLRRDPWLLSQSLMQMLYLLPPALMLWRSFSGTSTAIVLITPVVVMAAGQLAGGLAWLTISGEDAPDLVATAPLPPSRVTRAKVEVVLIAIAVVFAPLVAALAFASPGQAVVTAIGLWASANLVPGVEFTSTGSLIAAAVILGVVNAFVRPLSDKWFMSDSEVAALQAKSAAANAGPTGSFGIGRGGLDAKAALAWAAVGIPLLWGVWVTVKSSLALFG